MHWHADAVQAGRAGGKAGYLDGWKTGCTRAEQPLCKAAQHVPTWRNAGGRASLQAGWGGAAVRPLRSSTTCAMAVVGASRGKRSVQVRIKAGREMQGPCGCSSAAGCSCCPAAGGGGPVAPAPWAAPGSSTRSGLPFIPRRSGVGSVRGSEGGVHGTGMMHCRRSLGQQPAGQAGHACMQLCGSRLSGANNRFRGGFCPQRFCQ